MNLILDALYWIRDRLLALAGFAFNQFMEMNIFEKGIILNSIPAFFAIILPVAQFYIFEFWAPINNPFAVYMILIVCLMFGTHYFRGKFTAFFRMGINIYYLMWFVYMGAAGAISAAPYELTSGYFMNLLVPALYAGLSAGSHFIAEDK